MIMTFLKKPCFSGISKIINYYFLRFCYYLFSIDERICIEAAFAASLAHSSGPFLALDFAFGVFSGESFAAVSFTRASSFSLADSLGSAAFS